MLLENSIFVGDTFSKARFLQEYRKKCEEDNKGHPYNKLDVCPNCYERKPLSEYRPVSH